MVAFDANENLTPFREGMGYGAILFDRTQLRQVEPDWFDPGHWGDQARAVSSGGRGAAWFVDGPFGGAVLRHYLRGGLAARVSRDRHLWRGTHRVRSFAEFRLLRALLERKLPVPRPIAASYVRKGHRYRAAILLERIDHVHSLAHRANMPGEDAPWESAGRLIARFHRAGLDHADLNAHNLLFDDAGKGWMIDLDRSVMRIPATRWREGNLARLRRSLLKDRGAREIAQVDAEFARLRAAYDAQWDKGY
ncbi:3-deoxy-D-manno-octulosonic acid kinase [Lysobacter helvus]|uniref:3-deoxy-D-manno-octulosonic acid kinase n=2 Tax=Lysobacteraceae TaxID=32033 RepID=A0ABM7Q243_9GAMM|nr:MULTISPECIES: 3-deoxy-D-manno-octulosonic acid kinase [Lysobacter]BCT91230.1 3-deoxy-D-manno-octulosonic acid kinase [Lysobacter caseinilyticus]BCT94383.1 3-deoxy-D-manno-octulosonic acid kinase [Lysobacter helvus]